jgi:N-acyl-D-amino-acid deacylase
VVIGNCGFGFAPCKPADRDRAMLSLSRNEAVPLKTMQAGMPWDWVTFEEFLGSVDRTPKGVNVMAFVPLAPLYGYVVGIDEAKERRVNDDELAIMCDLLKEGMRVGACGFSSQNLGEAGNVQLDFDGTPMVTDMMTERELAAFCRAMGSLGRGVAQMTGPLETAAFMARESGRPIIWNALLADGALNQHGGAQMSHRDALKRLVELNEEEGLRVFAQALTTNFASEFTLEDYNLSDSVPAWREATVGTVAEKIVKLADPVRRAAMKEVHEQRGGLFGAGYPLNEIKVHWISSDVPNARQLKDAYEGYTIGEIARREGKHQIDAFLDVAVAGELRVGFATPLLATPPENMKEIATSPVALPGVSDGGAHTKFVTTARYATEMLGLWVREHQIMSLEEAHWRLSYYPAMAAGLKGRGFLAENAPADVIVYDPGTVDSLPAERLWDYPAGEWRLVQKPVGYHRIIVNGKTTFIDGQCTEATPGRLLRHGTD